MARAPTTESLAGITSSAFAERTADFTSELTQSLAVKAIDGLGKFYD
jgi:hypothetical protein